MVTREARSVRLNRYSVTLAIAGLVGLYLTLALPVSVIADKRLAGNEVDLADALTEWGIVAPLAASVLCLLAAAALRVAAIRRIRKSIESSTRPL